MKNTLIIFFVFILFSLSCTKIVEIKMPEFEPKLVVNSLFSPDSTFTVFITKTKKNTDSNIYFVDNAICKLYANGQFLFDMQYLYTGFYIAPGGYKPIPGVKYKIEVTSLGLPSVWAEDSVPTYTPVFNNLYVVDSVQPVADEEGRYYSELNFDLFDESDTKNYYEICHIERDDSVPLPLGDSATGFEHSNVIKSYDNVLTNEGLIDYYIDRYPFSDKLITSKHRFSVLIFPNRYSYNCFSNNQGFSYCDRTIAYYTLIVKIRSISENFYKYRKKLVLHENNQQGDFWTGTGNQVPMYTNIHNGFGIFAGFVEKIDSVKNYSF